MARSRANDRASTGLLGHWGYVREYRSDGADCFVLDSMRNRILGYFTMAQWGDAKTEGRSNYIRLRSASVMS